MEPGLSLIENVRLLIFWLLFFKAPALWADAFYKLICSYVCLCVCVSVCLFTFEVPFNCLFAPISQSQMSKTLRDLEVGGKVMETMVSNWKTFTNKGCEIAVEKKFVFGSILPNTEQVFLVSVFHTTFNGLFAPTS